MWLSYRHSGPSMTTPKSQFQVGPGTTLSLSGRWLSLGCIKTKPNTKLQNAKPDLILTQKQQRRKIRRKLSYGSFAGHLDCKCMWMPNFRHEKQAFGEKRGEKATHIGQCPQKHFCSVHKYSLGKKKKCLSWTLDFFFSFFGACNFYQFVLFLLLFFLSTRCL